MLNKISQNERDSINDRSSKYGELFGNASQTQINFIKSLLATKKADGQLIGDALEATKSYGNTTSKSLANIIIADLQKCDDKPKMDIDAKICGWASSSIIRKAKTDLEFGSQLFKLAAFTNKNINIRKDTNPSKIIKLAIDYKIKKVIDMVQKYTK
jgi:hypothetical protein